MQFDHVIPARATRRRRATASRAQPAIGWTRCSRTNRLEDPPHRHERRCFPLSRRESRVAAEARGGASRSRPGRWSGSGHRRVVGREEKGGHVSHPRRRGRRAAATTARATSWEWLTGSGRGVICDGRRSVRLVRQTDGEHRPESRATRPGSNQGADFLPPTNARSTRGMRTATACRRFTARIPSGSYVRLEEDSSGFAAVPAPLLHFSSG